MTYNVFGWTLNLALSNLVICWHFITPFGFIWNAALMLLSTPVEITCSMWLLWKSNFDDNFCYIITYKILQYLWQLGLHRDHIFQLTALSELIPLTGRTTNRVMGGEKKDVLHPHLIYSSVEYTVCLEKNIPNIFTCNSRKHCRIFIIFGTCVLYAGGLGTSATPRQD